jgi:GT2 family glycosyltransferase
VQDRVAVVVCSRDRATLLAEALPGVRAALTDDDELVVVDSASRDQSVADVGRAHGVDVVRVDQPGLSRARNAGWRATTAPVVLFTDDDCRPAREWRDAARRALTADDTVGAVWGSVASEGGSAGGFDLLHDDSRSPVEATLDSDLIAIGHGANMAFRRDVLESLDGFDEALGVGALLASAEDKDMFWRVLRAGWRVRSAPDMVVAHVRWRDNREALRQMYRYGVGAGALAVKRRRLGDRRRLIGRELWHHGAVPAARASRRLQPTLAAAAVVRTAGFIAGLRRGRRIPLRGEHFGG